jgi:hypothetical protein
VVWEIIENSGRKWENCGEKNSFIQRNCAKKKALGCCTTTLHNLTAAKLCKEKRIVQEGTSVQGSNPRLFCSPLHQPSAPDPHRDSGRADLLDSTALVVSHLSGRGVSAPLRLSRAGPARQDGRARLAGGRPGRMAGRRRLAKSDRRVLARAGPSIRS